MKKRFIAGAKCPQCGLLDKIFVLKSEEGESRHCVSCDFEDRLEEDPKPEIGEWSPIKLEDY